MTLVIDRLTHRFAVQNYLFTLLGVIFVGLAIMWLMLGVSSNPYLIFTLPLFFELVYMLFSLQFVALLSRLLNVRQTKRLSGITRSGEFLAEIAGGFLVIVLLNFIQVTDLLEIQPLANRVLGRIEQEPDPAVRGQALMTYAALAAPDTIDMLKPYLDSSDQNLRKGALVGILSFDRDDAHANDYLLNSVRSRELSERFFAAEVIGEIGSGHFSGYLVELLEDLDLQVIERAINAAGNLHDTRLVNMLVNKLSIVSLQGSTSLSLRQFGESALYDLGIGLTSPEASRQEKSHIIDTIREIGGSRATELLLRHLEIKQPELKHQIYLSLATLHYQADPDDQYVFVNILDEEVQFITWLLAAMEDLYGHKQYATLHLALASELDVRRDNMLLLISFLFPSLVMLDTRANIDSKVSELRVFALEILDNLLTGEIKQIVLPLLDDLPNRQ